MDTEVEPAAKVKGLTWNLIPRLGWPSLSLDVVSSFQKKHSKKLCINANFPVCQSGPRLGPDCADQIVC